MIIFMRNARARIFLHLFQRFRVAIDFLIIESKFCIFWYRKQILVLISSCMEPAQDSISIWYHIVVYRFSHRVGHELPTNANGRALAAQCTTSLHHKVWIGRRWHAEARVHICVCFMYVQVCLNVGFDATAWTKRIHDVLVSPGTSYFLGPLIRIVSPVKSWIPRECNVH